MKIDVLEYAMSELYDFILGLPSGLDGFDDIDFDAAFAELEKVKSDEVVEVMHGKWVCINERYGTYQCSACMGFDEDVFDFEGCHDVTSQEFCPHCGAKMDLKE